MPALSQGLVYRGPGDLTPQLPQSSSAGIDASGLPQTRLPDERNLSRWTFWWEFNKAHFLSGSGPVSTLGQAHADQRENQRPTKSDVDGKILPALRAALETSEDEKFTAALLIALGRTSDPLDSTGLLKVLTQAAESDALKVRLAGVLALGLFDDPRAVPQLFEILDDTSSTGEFNGAPEAVRAFAACSLGLIGSSATDEAVRRAIAASLVSAFEDDDSARNDIKIACVIALGFIQLKEPDAPDRNPSDLPTTHAKACAWLLGVLGDTKLPTPIRAQVPLALSHLFLLPRSEESRTAIASALFDELAKAQETEGGERVAESCALALGQLGTTAPGELDVRIRKTLIGLGVGGSPTQLYGFSLVALAQLAGQHAGQAAAPQAISTIAAHIQAQLAGKDGERKQWAGLAAGILLRAVGQAAPASLAKALKDNLVAERTPRAASYAIGAGLAGDPKLVPTLLAKLNEIKDDETQGSAGLALGMLQASDSQAALAKLFKESKYRPLKKRQLALALGELGGKASLETLLESIPNEKSQTVQSAVALGISTLGDRRAIAPLCTMLADDGLDPKARAVAATALGLLASKRAYPWHDEFATYFNYRAATNSLMSFDLPGLLLRP